MHGSDCWKLAGVMLLLAVGAARADDQPNDRAKENRSQEVRDLVDFVRHKGYYALADTKEKEAIAKLRMMAEEAAPVVARMLTEGLKNRESGWIEVYRPLYILEGMGEHAKVALPDIIKALDDKHLINVGQAARVLGQIGPSAMDAVAKLQQVWEKPMQSESTRKLAADAIKKIDPKTAEKLGIK
jgi:HEAT repeat protein